MLDDSSQGNKLSRKVLAVFLCAVVLLSSLGISAQPAAAQIPLPEDAEFYFYLIFPHLQMWGSGFPPGERFNIRIKIDDKDPVPLKETVYILPDGTFEKNVKLGPEFGDIRNSLEVCLNNEKYDKICGKEYTGFVIIPHNQCTPSRNWGLHVKRYLR